MFPAFISVILPRFFKWFFQSWNVRDDPIVELYSLLEFLLCLIFSSVSFVVFLGERLQKRVKIHSGSDEQVLTELEKYGVTKDMFASPIGGNAEVDMAKYIAECRKAGK